MGANRICMESGFIPEVNVGCGPILLDPAWQDISFSWGDKTRITLHPDGSVEIDPEWAIDETAKFFWNAVMRVAGGEPKFPEAAWGEQPQQTSAPPSDPNDMNHD